jgi:hypothetical protein
VRTIRIVACSALLLSRVAKNSNYWREMSEWDIYICCKEVITFHQSIDSITAERWTRDLRSWVQIPADPKFQFFSFLKSYYIKMDALISNLMSIGTLDSKVPDSCANEIWGNSSIN